MRVVEQSTEALPPHYWTRLATNCALRRDQLIVETLMIAAPPLDLVVKFQPLDIVDVILRLVLRPRVVYQQEIKG